MRIELAGRVQHKECPFCPWVEDGEGTVRLARGRDRTSSSLHEVRWKQVVDSSINIVGSVTLKVIISNSNTIRGQTHTFLLMTA